MKCNICGRNYIALGVHLRHKHKIAPADYKEQYGMLLATPLVDEWLSERMKTSQHQRLEDPEYKAELFDRCRVNAKANIGGGSTRMTRAGKDSVSSSNKKRNQKYLLEQSVVVAKVLLEKGTMLDVLKATGSSPTAAKKMAEIAGIPYSKESAKAVRDKRVAATNRAKALLQVAKVIPYLNTTKSAAEMCRLAQISRKTYRNWLTAGLIARHPNGRGPRGDC